MEYKDGTSTEKCQICQDGFFLNKAVNTCLLFNCQIMDKYNYSNPKCVTCMQGYVLTNSNKWC